MILDLIQNPHYVIDINSYEGIRNIVVTILVFVSILVLGRNLSKSKNLLILKIICAIAIISTGYDHIIDAIHGNWRVEEDLPLHLCSLSNLIVCIILFTPINKKIFEFLFYCGFLGGLVSILTPQLNYYDGGWFMYLSYYSSHGIIMLVPLFMYYNLNYKLTKYSWLRTFGILNIFMIFILPLNFLIGSGSNYMYLYEAPNIKNPLVFGDWPYYIINWEIIIIVLFYLTYFIFTRKKI
ncbi:TIGR02206 family membrane protein [Flavobacteriaceae bacterium]|nr:TIGR02206 family membrane protein [Flavobacteriaceae bacterium]